MLVHNMLPPVKPGILEGYPPQFPGTHLYGCVERGTVRIACFAQEHNTMTLGLWVHVFDIS